MKTLKFEKSKKIIQQLKKKIIEEKNKQKGNEAGLDNQFLMVLEKYGIKMQTFHAGATNGINCCRLLDNTGSIFEYLTKLKV